MSDEMMLSTKLAGSIEGFLAMTGLSGRFLDYLGALPPGALLVVDTVHLWLPAVTLVAFLLFGPVAASRVRGAGMGNRAWLALSTALTIRQLVLWFTSLPPVKGMLLAIGIEIIPARARPLVDESVPDAVAGTVGARECIAAQYESVANVPTSLSSRVEGEVQLKDYREFRERMAGMPERLPALESGGEWHEMMHKTMEGMSYRAWRHVLPYGGTEYLSRTFFEDSTVEEMCDFFNSDEVRASWDRLLYRHRVLERDERTGAEAVFWERALPVISNRDYVFSRRTWKDGETYWAITKGCQHAGSPETPGLKRVDPYFSSWRMRAVRGRDGKMGSECILSHFEEQHVNQDVARFAVKCGMWGVVKNMDGGFRRFQRDRRARAAAAAAAAGVGPGGLGLGAAASAAGLGYSAAPQIDRVGGGGGGGGKGELLRRLALGAAVSASVGVLAAMDANHRGEARNGSSRRANRAGALLRARRRRVAADVDVEAMVEHVLDQRFGSEVASPGAAAAAVGAAIAAGEPGWSGAAAIKMTPKDTPQR